MKITLDVPKEDINYVPPFEFVPEEKKDADWFLRWARYLCTFYNPPAYRWDYWNLNSGKTNSGTDITNWQFRLTDEMLNNYAYLFGQQPNINYMYLTQDASGQTFQSPWIKGRKAGMIVDFANGDMMDSLDNVTFDAVSLSKEVITRKQQLFDKIDLAIDMDEMMQPLSEMGISFQPYHKKLSSKEEAAHEKLSYKDELERDLIYLAEDGFLRNDMKYQYSKAYLNTLCGIGAVYNYVENGKGKKKVIPCYNLIFDNQSGDDDFGRKMRYWGFVEYMTPAQALSAIPDLNAYPGAVKELEAIGAGNVENLQPFYNYYNSNFANMNFQWWRTEQGRNLVSVATLFWIAPRDLKFKKYINDYGQKRIASIQEDEKYQSQEGQYLTMDIHKVRLVGNKWACDFGYAKNTVRDFSNKGNPVPNMTFFIPGMTMGQPRPVMSMIKKNQDEIDRLAHKLREITGRDLGKVWIVNAAAMGEAGKGAVEFSDDIKNLGGLVARDSGEYQRMTQNMRLVDVIDLSTNSQLLSYLELKREEEAQMEQLVGYSKIALGQQSGYVSQGVQQTTMSTSSNVLRYTAEGFIEFMRRDMEYYCNMIRPIVGMGGEKSELLVGKDGVRLMKSLGRERFSDAMVYLKIERPIDDATRARILQYALAWSQNPAFGISADLILMLESEKSLGRMIRKFELALQEQKIQAQQQQNYQNMISMIQQQAAQQNAQEIAAMQEQNKAQMAQAKNQTSLAGDILSHSSQMASLGAGMNSPQQGS